MSVREILSKTNYRLVTIRPEDTIETAAQMLTINNIGAIPVREASGKMVGMLSERDLVRGYASKGGAIMTAVVKDLMSPNVISCKAQESVNDAMTKMSQRHIRHLPVVVDNGELLGMISIRDVMGFLLEESKIETDELRAYAIASGGHLH